LATVSINYLKGKAVGNGQNISSIRNKLLL